MQLLLLFLFVFCRLQQHRHCNKEDRKISFIHKSWVALILQLLYCFVTNSTGIIWKNKYRHSKSHCPLVTIILHPTFYQFCPDSFPVLTIPVQFWIPGAIICFTNYFSTSCYYETVLDCYYCIILWPFCCFLLERRHKWLNERTNGESEKKEKKRSSFWIELSSVAVRLVLFLVLVLW